MAGEIEKARYKLIRSGEEFLMAVGLHAKEIEGLQPTEILGLCVTWTESDGVCVMCGRSPVEGLVLRAHRCLVI